VEDSSCQQPPHTAEKGEHKDSHQWWGTGLGAGTSQLWSKAITHPAAGTGWGYDGQAKRKADKGWGLHNQMSPLNYTAGLLLRHISSFT